MLLRPNLRLCFERFHSSARTYAVSKASYGWLAHLPTAKVCWNQWTALRTGQRSLKRANRHIRAILFGGTSHLDCLTAGNLLRCIRQLKDAGRIRWHNRGGSPLWTLRRWLQWENQACKGPRLNPGDFAARKKRRHLARLHDYLRIASRAEDGSATEQEVLNLQALRRVLGAPTLRRTRELIRTAKAELDAHEDRTKTQALKSWRHFTPALLR